MKAFLQGDNFPCSKITSTTELLIGLSYSPQWDKLEFIPKTVKELRLFDYGFGDSSAQQMVNFLVSIFQLQERKIKVVSKIQLGDEECIDIKPESKCPCGLPSIYRSKYWKGKTPKELLEDWFRKNFPKSVPKYEQHIPNASTSFCTKVILPHLKENGKPKEVISKAISTNKKESEQNAALEAIHFLHGDIKKEKNQVLKKK